MKTTFTSIGTGNTTKDNTISQHQCSVSVKDDTFHLIGEQLVSGVGTLSNLPSFVSANCQRERVKRETIPNALSWSPIWNFKHIFFLLCFNFE